MIYLLGKQHFSFRFLYHARLERKIYSILLRILNHFKSTSICWMLWLGVGAWRVQRWGRYSPWPPGTFNLWGRRDKYMFSFWTEKCNKAKDTKSTISTQSVLWPYQIFRCIKLDVSKSKSNYIYNNVTCVSHHSVPEKINLIEELQKYHS